MPDGSPGNAEDCKRNKKSPIAPGKLVVSAPERTTPKPARAYLITDDDVAAAGRGCALSATCSRPGSKSRPDGYRWRRGSPLRTSARIRHRQPQLTGKDHRQPEKRERHPISFLTDQIAFFVLVSESPIAQSNC